MNKLTFWGFRQALNKLALVAFVVANVAPAFGQSMSVSSTYIPFTPSLLNDPTLLMQTQANINIYGTQGNSLGQLLPGSIFQTQMSRDPFHYVMSQPTFNYPSVFQTAVQMPTSMGPMVPGVLEQPAMLHNGMTLPIDTSFYIPPADFSYQNIRAIGARTDSEDEDINRLIEEVIFGSSGRDSDSNFDSDDDYDSSFSSRSYKSDSSSFYSPTLKPSQDTVRPAAQAPRYSYTQQVISNSPFKILGPTCGCKDKGMSCVYNRHNHGRNMYKGIRKGRNGTRTHDGIDIIGRTGTPIIAAADGVVVTVSNSGKTGYGQKIDVKHVDNFMTRYAHLSRMIVRPGQRVKKGQVIGYLGNTGASSGAHLHFEACKLRGGETRCHDGNVVNPLHYMTNGGSNQQQQLNLSCTEAAAIGSSQVSAPAARRTSPAAARAARSGRAAQ